MKIIGQGMIAQSLLPYRDRFPNAVIFASGVANSHTTDAQAYEREYQLLYDTLRICAAEDQQIVYFSSAGAIYGAMDLPVPRRPRFSRPRPMDGISSFVSR